MAGFLNQAANFRARMRKPSVLGAQIRDPRNSRASFKKIAIYSYLLSLNNFSPFAIASSIDPTM